MEEITVSPSGKFAAGVLLFLDESVVVLESRTRTMLAKIKAARALTFIPSPSGHENFILTRTQQAFMVWDHSCGAQITLLPEYSDLEGDLPPYWKADVGKNFFFACSNTGTVLVWETQSLALVHTYRHVLLSTRTWYFDPNGVHISLE